ASPFRFLFLFILYPLGGTLILFLPLYSLSFARNGQSFPDEVESLTREKIKHGRVCQSCFRSH
ncbi:MAG: hypothetical protein LBI02_06005, partial [Opitutaceae bacterium]|nr:hypothetical protein [Opitutaceae bacterium]